MNCGGVALRYPHTLKIACSLANQLIAECNESAGWEWHWTYDAAGNITSKKEINLETGERADYYYDYDQTWGDLLTFYDGRIFSYDANGNLTNDRIWEYTWQQGRQLATMSNGSTTWTYTYDANGMRIGRSNGTKTYSYLYTNGLLSRMILDDDTLCFAYDAVGAPLTVNYNGTTFYYVTNLQGDVIAILDRTGYPVVQYTYNAWGELLSATGPMLSSLGALNPLLYRGYVYDRETGLYYVSSRYYNPEIGRWINADNRISGVGGSILGYNMFAYCMNNPVNMSDPTGSWPKWIETAANWVNNNIIQPVASFIEKSIDYLTPTSKEDHYNRNQNNIQFPEEYDETFFKDWDDSVSANCHQFSAPNRDNVKYVSPDGKYEAIYDVNNKLVTDPRDVGTYNFISPNEDPFGHFIKDVIPWIQHGNSPNDSTEWWQRALSFIAIYV